MESTLKAVQADSGQSSPLAKDVFSTNVLTNVEMGGTPYRDEVALRLCPSTLLNVRYGFQSSTCVPMLPH